MRDRVRLPPKRLIPTARDALQVRAVLEAIGGDVKATARALDVSERVVYQAIAQLGLPELTLLGLRWAAAQWLRRNPISRRRA